MQLVASQRILETNKIIEMKFQTYEMFCVGSDL